ncbi:winged helix-turn-helix domain-containing protein [Sorangium sp. So ce726]|uniref:ATP-binding protein n=1 Tax=Sorangium sp. So ce726 TaxID=3133319 RepID=UPI003F5E9929
MYSQLPKPCARNLPAEGGAAGSFAFGQFVLIPERQLLLEDGAPVRIARRARDLLTALVLRPGELVSKDELIAHAWPELPVDEGNLKVNIGALRRVLHDDPDEPRYIATVVGRGYRFVAPVRRSDSPDPGSSADALPKPASALPARSAPIFGRAAMIASILRDLASSRLVSIVGPGGIGKTTVALAVAREAADVFEGGAFFVDLAAVDDNSRVVDAVAAALGLNTLRAESHAGLGELRDRKLLLVLDNCEHLIDAVAGCAHQILTSAKDVRLLTTSREALCLKNERVRRLTGLSTPPAASQLRTEQALDFAAIQLFVDRATHASPAFTLSDANAATIAEICRRLEGLALAIECVALRIETLGLDGMLDCIGNRSLMFVAHPADPERHRTMTALMDWSYKLLSDDAKVVMQRLSTFAGSFTLQSACEVAARDGVDPIRVVEEVASLAAKSLLATEPRDGEVDYRQSAVVRAFALEKLAAHGDRDDAQRRHAEHFLRLAEEAEADGETLPKLAWLARHGAKLEDIRSALSWALDHRASADLAVRLAVTAIPFWKQHGLTKEGRAALERVLGDGFSAHRSAHDDQRLNAALAEMHKGQATP